MTQNNRLLGALAAASGAIWMFLGVIHITSSDKLDQETLVEGAIGHLNLAGLSLALVLLVPVMFALARYATRPTGAKIASAGMVGLAVLATISNVRGEDPSFFPFVAVATNLLWLGGSVVLAVSLRRAGRVPKAIAIALPLTQIAALPLATLGGPILTGAYWMAVAYLMRDEAMEGSIRPAVAVT